MGIEKFLKHHLKTDWLDKSPLERAVILIEIVYWLLIFEGALRKWFLPFLAKPLYFIRDPFCIYLYYLCWKHHLIDTKNPFFRAFVVVSVIFVMVMLVQVFLHQNSLLTSIYGWRMYFFNVPLAFICGTVLSGKDLKRIAKRTLLVAIPMAALVILQYRSPIDSFINKTIDGADAFNYGGIPRASGTYSFTAGHAMFCHSALCFLIATWLLPVKYRPLKGRWLWLATAGTFVNVILDGNRSVLLDLAITMVFALIFRLTIMRERFSIRSYGLEAVCVIAGIVYMTVFGDAFTAMKTRVQENQGEAKGRLIDVVAGMGPALTRTYITGTGIGAGTTGGKQLLGYLGTHSRSADVEEENELGRILIEAGPAGYFYILLRFALAGSMTRDAYVASKRSRNSLPLILVTFPAFLLVAGQISFNGTSNGYAWVFIGFALAANQIGAKPRSLA